MPDVAIPATYFLRATGFFGLFFPGICSEIIERAVPLTKLRLGLPEDLTFGGQPSDAVEKVGGESRAAFAESTSH